MINRDSRGHSYFIVRGEILGYERRTTAKAFAKDVFINQERKLGARRRSDTVLVSTINDQIPTRDQRMLLLGLRWHLMRNQSLWVPGGVWSQG